MCSTRRILSKSFSDHQPYFIFLNTTRITAPTPKLVKINVPSAKAFSDFKNELIKSNIYNQLDKNPFANPDNDYRIIFQLINEAKSIHMPVKLVKFRKHKHKKSSWITPGILKSIKFRDKLYQSYKCAEPNTTNYITLHTNLKTYNRILKKTIRKAKLIYFTGRFDRCQNDIQQTWTTINSILKACAQRFRYALFAFIHTQTYFEYYTLTLRLESLVKKAVIYAYWTKELFDICRENISYMATLPSVARHVITRR